MITYETSVKVKLDGKHVGTIKKVKNGSGYQYIPKGCKASCGSAVYGSIESVKKTL